jgi:quercetin dioxygenase-like cupin family protein
MIKKIEIAISELQDSWTHLTKDSINAVQSTLQTLAKDSDVKNQLFAGTLSLPKGLELHRDQKEGFVLLAYSESHGTYRAPHDHGRAWVIYVVASGSIEMGNYFNANSGDARIYYPGEIHDTRCTSDNTLILRLTSFDLKEEDRAGRLRRYEI